MNRFSVKFFLKPDSYIEPETLIPIFHRWIQQNALPGLLIDVADYRHVPQGPSIILIGHEADYAFDERRGQPGLNVVYKRGGEDSFAANLRTAFQTAKDACQSLETEPSLDGIQFDYSLAHIISLDRLNAPNNPETFAAYETELAEVIRQFSPSDTITLSSIETDSRKTFTVQVEGL